MVRINEREILENPGLPDHIVERAYRDIAGIHRFLGDTRAIVNAIRADPQPVHRILDVGCGTGVVLKHVGDALNVDVVGADIQPRPRVSAPVPIVRADACCDPLPSADVAICMYLCHHLPPHDVVRMIRNVGRYCRRFILLDLVRHPVPLALFRAFVAPLICDVDAQDGRRSIRRSYTTAELHDLTVLALQGSGASFRPTLTPFWLRQVIDISYAPLEDEPKSAVSLTVEEERCLR
ncbi:MAG: methyltransferase domain-containing protein [Ignavibacteriota bacterium]